MIITKTKRILIFGLLKLYFQKSKLTPLSDAWFLWHPFTAAHSFQYELSVCNSVQISSFVIDVENFNPLSIYLNDYVKVNILAKVRSELFKLLFCISIMYFVFS